MNPETQQEAKQTEQAGAERHPVRNAAAAVVGAFEGLREGLEEEHLVEESQRTIHNVGEVARAASGEARRQWQSPEMEDLRRDTAHTAEAARERVRDATADAAATVQRRAHDATEVVQEKTHEVQDRVRHGVGEVRQTTTHLAHEGKVRAQAVAETSRRAARAPKHIGDDLREAGSSYAHSLTAGWGLFALAGVLGVASLVVLTVGLVVWLNALLGSPAGYFLTVLGYLVVAGVLAGVAVARRRKHREEAREHVRDVRREVRHVTRPVRRAFNDHNR